ncbi:MAG: hypothetical protein ACREXU_17810 [Gammaproteobacteria bacterium]
MNEGNRIVRDRCGSFFTAPCACSDRLGKTSVLGMSHGIESHVRKDANDSEQGERDNDIHGYKSSKASMPF